MALAPTEREEDKHKNSYILLTDISDTSKKYDYNINATLVIECIFLELDKCLYPENE